MQSKINDNYWALAAFDRELSHHANLQAYPQLDLHELMLVYHELMSYHKKVTMTIPYLYELYIRMMVALQAYKIVLSYYSAD